MKNKNKFNLILIAVIFIAIAGVILSRPLSNLDEVWNFNFARNIANNMLPYKDFNMIQTPLLPMISGIFLKIFGTEMIVTRFLGIILSAAILFTVYKILELLKINKYAAILSIIGVYVLLFNYFGLDYNFATLLVVLIVLYNEIKHVDKFNFWNGVLIGLTILLKQNTGLVLSFVFIFYKFLMFPIKKETFKIILTRALGVFVPVAILALYLTINNIWKDFFDYAIYGLKTFTNYIPYTSLLKGNIAVIILSILVPISFLYMIYRYIKTRDKTIYILLAYSAAAFIIAFPISDGMHFTIGSIPAIIAIIYIIWDKIKDNKYLYSAKKFIKIIVDLTVIGIIAARLILIVIYINNIYEKPSLNHFRYIETTMVSKARDIENYILNQEQNGKKVYILDSTAALYMIPIDKYNKNYDMFNKGNLGAGGEEGQIQNLEKEKNCIVLILNDNHGRNWQNPELVREYIINNWTKIGELNQFDIYENNVGM